MAKNFKSAGIVAKTGAFSSELKLANQSVLTGIIAGANITVNNNNNGTFTISGSAGGSASIPANLITGSGTANYIPKFIGQTGVANSVIYDNGNIGIKTNSPGHDLEISGDLGLNGYIYNTIDNIPVIDVNSLILIDSNGNNIFRWADGAELYGKTLIKKDGGATTANPDTNATLVLDSAANATNMWFNLNSAGSNGTLGFTIDGSYYHGITYNIENNYLVLSSDASNPNPSRGLFIDSNNYIGLNISTPSCALHIEDPIQVATNWFGLKLNSSVEANPIATFQAISDSSFCGLRYDGSGGKFFCQAANGTRIEGNGGGLGKAFVGSLSINSESDPLYTLAVNGSGNFSNGLYVNGISVLTGNVNATQLNSQPGSYYLNYTNMTGSIIGTGDANTLGGQSGSYYRNLANFTGSLSGTGSFITNIPANLITGSGTPNYIPKFVGQTGLAKSLIYDNGTNVAINTASPNYNLDVNGSINGSSYYLNAAPLDFTKTWSNLTWGSTTTWNVNTGIYVDKRKLIMTGNSTLAINGLYNGWEGLLQTVQSGAAASGYSLTLPASTKVAFGGSGKLYLTSGSGIIDMIGLQYDGTNLFASIANKWN